MHAAATYLPLLRCRDVDRCGLLDAVDYSRRSARFPSRRRARQWLASPPHSCWLLIGVFIFDSDDCFFRHLPRVTSRRWMNMALERHGFLFRAAD